MVYGISLERESNTVERKTPVVLTEQLKKASDVAKMRLRSFIETNSMAAHH